MDQHPIQPGRRDLSMEERLLQLEVKAAQLWDQVWWMNLSQGRRDQYRAEGFRDPIEKFYL